MCLRVIFWTLYFVLLAAAVVYPDHGVLYKIIHVVTCSGLLLRENDSLNKRMAYLSSRHDTTTQKLR